MNFEIFFEENESIIRTAIRSVCKKMFHTNTECEECEGKLFLEIVEKDFLILRSFRGGITLNLELIFFLPCIEKLLIGKEKKRDSIDHQKKLWF